MHGRVVLPVLVPSLVVVGFLLVFDVAVVVLVTVGVGDP